MSPHTKKQRYEFTKDWFSHVIPTWDRFLPHLRGKPVSTLEIGSYEGRSALWLVEHFLTHPDAKVHCVDNFKPEIGKRRNLYRTFLKNIAASGSSEKFVVHKDNSSNILKRDLYDKKFDFIYIDGGRGSKNVLEDIILSFPLLKPGGILILDDDTHSREHTNSCPRMAIDAFRNIFNDEIQVMQDKWVVVLKKNKKPAPLRVCKSEIEQFTRFKDIM